MAWSSGERAALDRLLPLLYEELRRLAGWHLASQGPGHTLQPTALVHEAYLRLVKHQRVGWRGRAHFMAAAAQAMRHVLVDHARAKAAQKRGGAGTRVTLTDLEGTDQPSVEVIDVDRALEKLARHDADKARVVELRYFGGLTIEETAEVTESSPATVKRHWNFAKAWLAREMEAVGHGA